MTYSIITCHPDIEAQRRGEDIRVSISDDIAKKMMYDDEIDGVLLSILSFCDQDVFEDDELIKIKSEINELIEKQILSQEEMRDVLKLIQFAIDDNRAVLFSPFNCNDVPLAQFD